MQQEDENHQRDDQHLLDQRAPQRGDRFADQLGTVVDGDDLDAVDVEGEKDGAPVAVMANIEVNFKLM
jgi:hypothetical protein